MPRVEGTYREDWRDGTLGGDGCLLLDLAVSGVEGIKAWIMVENLVVSVQIHLEAVPQNEDRTICR